MMVNSMQDKLKNSLDVRYYKIRLLIIQIAYLIIVIIGVLWILFNCIIDECDNVTLHVMMLIIPVTCFTLPIILYYCFKILYLRSNSNRYTLYEVLLCEVIPYSDKVAGFNIEIQTELNNVIKVCTNPIFALTSWLGTPIDECINRKATIAFDDYNGRVVVINIVND